jgi:hypothetical protein
MKRAQPAKNAVPGASFAGDTRSDCAGGLVSRPGGNIQAPTSP